ncbi:hypothetical protein BIV25_06165 [Streptomyces sp. MUSC 14]|uniref:hypothetical protein n=1 Tax=Streptomyces sp. MUSC 14 TaxID=1354889 RepID=UPI0008F55C1D|nr:hypothetical protein [Streptomyces sp. MUSC 14]OIK00729.1 hypothetical protein BIV25_06165 [Streptomyces sp. MUSC 14]
MAPAVAPLAGLDAGGSVRGLTQLIAVGFDHRSTAMPDILDAHVGIGAILGPALGRRGRCRPLPGDLPRLRATRSG